MIIHTRMFSYGHRGSTAHTLHRLSNGHMYVTNLGRSFQESCPHPRLILMVSALPYIRQWLIGSGRRGARIFMRTLSAFSSLQSPFDSPAFNLSTPNCLFLYQCHLMRAPTAVILSLLPSYATSGKTLPMCSQFC